MRLVGVLGGMGPDATVLLMERVIAARPAADDAGHVPLLVFQYPQVPSRIAALIEGTGPSPAPVLADLARRLEAAGAEAIAMPCNTAHAYAPDIRAAVTVPFLDMIAETVGALVAKHGAGARIGMLASPAARKARVFNAAFAEAGLTPVWSAEEDRLLAVIRAVKAGRVSEADRESLARIGRDLSAGQGCAALLVACTELSILAPDLPGDLVWIDSLDCLAARIVAFSVN